jgi:hypothetical protein
VLAMSRECMTSFVDEIILQTKYSIIAEGKILIKEVEIVYSK